MEKQVAVLEWKDKDGKDIVYNLSWAPFNMDIDMDELTTVHHWNLVAEILTIPTLLNKINQLKADAESALRIYKLEHDVLVAKKAEEYRKSLITNVDGKTKHPTVDAVANAVMLDKEVYVSKYTYYNIQRNVQVIDGLYWSVIAKQKEVDKFTSSLTPADLEKEIIEETINSILIRKREKKF